METYYKQYYRGNLLYFYNYTDSNGTVFFAMGKSLAKCRRNKKFLLNLNRKETKS